MVLAQIERLKKDSNDLEIYARKLAKKGLESRAEKIQDLDDEIKDQVLNHLKK